jgi:protein-disulfide isomerase
MPTRLAIAAFFSLAISMGSMAAAEKPSSPALTEAQKGEVEQIVRDYLQRHPEAIIDAIESARQMAEEAKSRQAQFVVASRRVELVADPATPIGGNPHGDVTIVEFFDYRCPYCKQVQPAIEALLAQDSKLRIAYKEFPILGPASVFAARVALAARNQERYTQFHTAMMATKGQIDETVIEGVARRVGLDWERVKKDMTAPDVDVAIRRNIELARALAIGGTPGFVIGRRIADGAADIDSLKEMVENARALE